MTAPGATRQGEIVSTIAKEMLARWTRIRERLEANSPAMEAANIHVDWSDICVLDAYLSDDWNESWMGPKPTVEPTNDDWQFAHAPAPEPEPPDPPSDWDKENDDDKPHYDTPGGW